MIILPFLFVFFYLNSLCLSLLFFSCPFKQEIIVALHLLSICIKIFGELVTLCFGCLDIFFSAINLTSELFKDRLMLRHIII